MERTLLVIANGLAIAGVLTVVILLSAAARGRWKKGVAYRAMAWSSVVGGVIPLPIFAIWPFVNSHFGASAGSVLFDNFAEVLWPSSLGLLALNNPQSVAFYVAAVLERSS